MSWRGLCASRRTNFTEQMKRVAAECCQLYPRTLQLSCERYGSTAGHDNSVGWCLYLVHGLFCKCVSCTFQLMSVFGPWAVLQMRVMYISVDVCIWFMGCSANACQLHFNVEWRSYVPRSVGDPAERCHSMAYRLDVCLRPSDENRISGRVSNL